MKIVKGYTVAGQLLVQGHTDLVAKVGDIVRLYLDQVSDPELPEFIRATVETPIIPLQNGTQTSYGFSYDETLLDGAITRLRAKDIVDVLVYSTQGRSAYESYLITTDDDPVLTEAEWSGNSNLSDLNDVAISSPTSGQSLFRNGSNLWVNRAIESGDILPAIQGAEADPSKIGSEYMPDSLELDYVQLGDAPTAVLPVGTLTRSGNSLRLHDNVTEGGVPVASSSLGDPSSFVGYKESLPFGTAGSSVKQASTSYYDEVGRIVLQGNQVVDGNTFYLWAWTKVKSDITPGLTNRSFMLVPASLWDVDPQSQFFGVSPSNSTFATAPNLALWRPLASSSLETECIFARANVITLTGGNITMSAAPTGTYGRGFDETTSARISLGDTGGMISSAAAPGEDLEFVIVAKVDAGGTRLIDANIKISAR